MVEYVNNLYIYPLLVKMHHPNLQVEVTLKDDDTDPDELGPEVSTTLLGVLGCILC